VGPVRHRQLIRLLAFVVALDLTAGVVALYTRGGTASAANHGARTSGAGDRAGDAAAVGTDGAPGGILAGGRFTRRRGSDRKSTGATPEGPAGRAAAPASAAGSSTSTATAPASGGSTTTSSTGRPTTTSTGRPSTSSTARPTTSSASGPGTTAGPAAGSDRTPGAPSPSASNGSPATTAPANAARTTATFKDPAGDTIVQDSGKATAERRADIVQSHVSYGAKDLVFAVLTDDPVDPGQDPNWASDSTFVAWELDTDGDAVPDYEVQFAFSDGMPVAGVSRPGDTDGSSVCEAEAAYTAERYAVGVDPECIGRPASLSYHVAIYYDRDPKNEDSDVVTDLAPDGGLSRPVARPAG
jgi:hypothetical protein